MKITYRKCGVERIYQIVCMSSVSQTDAGLLHDIGIMYKPLSQILKK